MSWPDLSLLFANWKHICPVHPTGHILLATTSIATTLIKRQFAEALFFVSNIIRVGRISAICQHKK